ncbi:MAG TPA: TetR-like C-terminal domain-containing protein [Woeseiaceae bacterium]
MPISIAAQYYAASLMSLLVSWMDHHYPYTPDEMEKCFHPLVVRPTGGADQR